MPSGRHRPCPNRVVVHHYKQAPAAIVQRQNPRRRLGRLLNRHDIEAQQHDAACALAALENQLAEILVGRDQHAAFRKGSAQHLFIGHARIISGRDNIRAQSTQRRRKLVWNASIYRETHAGSLFGRDADVPDALSCIRKRRADILRCKARERFQHPGHIRTGRKLAHDCLDRHARTGDHRLTEHDLGIANDAGVIVRVHDLNITEVGRLPKARSLMNHPYLSRDYIDLQVRFAEAMAEKSGLPFADALLSNTNVHRRIGLGVPDPTAPRPELWLELTADIDPLTHDQRVDRIHACLSARPNGALVVLAGRFDFGCFACEAPNASGAVRIHFGNREQGYEVGPIHHSRLPARRAELAEMFGWLARAHPGATSVDGGSWLYNLEAYRRLYPASFTSSRKPRAPGGPVHGMSSWGQFITSKGDVRPDVRDAFLAAVPTLDVNDPQAVFPYQVLITHGPIADFQRLYGVRAD